MQVGCGRCGHLLEFSHQPPRFCSHCGQPLVSSPEATQPGDLAATSPYAQGAPSSQSVPEQLGGYRLLRQLGGGGMGTVFEAQEIATGRHVALKLIRPELAESSDSVERFRREGRLAGTITHPRCVFVLAAEEELGRPYLVMELMPGATLHDLVAERGPLPVAEAVAFVLDVIEGLQEAHRCGVIHRDVKPNNCFLDHEGRVKVGDFGLSKSLVQAGQLTRSGAFLGSVLFAAPEQVRNDRVDHLADVYSVCATLYYLLSGRAPFQADDAAAALARTLTDPFTPMRALRPELPRTLDEVVQRGLARSRARRWQGLEELRLALLPFVPGPHALGEVGWRCGAFLCDLMLLFPIDFILRRALFALFAGAMVATQATAWLVLSSVAALGCGLIYFALPEASWGCSLGKYLMRLRVRNAANEDRPGLGRALVRTLVFYAVMEGGPLLLGLLLVAVVIGPGVPLAGITEAVGLALLAVVLLPFFGSLAGLGLLASTMRRRNGYRGLHDLASGTKVIRLPAPRPRRWRGDEASVGGPLGRPEGMPARLGTFTILGALRWTKDMRLLLGEDELLDRLVWIWQRPAERGPLPAGRAEVSRSTRPRWLGGGLEGAWRWDAFVASPGCALADLGPSGQRVPWADALDWLEPLTSELVIAAREGTLPVHLRPEQVWLQPSGRAQLLEVALREEAPLPGPAEGEAGALEMLRQAVVLALEGRPRSADDLALPLRAPLPGHAAELLHRLVGGPGGFTTLAELQADLKAARERPAEVSRPRGGARVSLNGLLLGPVLLGMLSIGPILIAVGIMISVLAGAFKGEDANRELRARMEQSSVGLVTAPGAWQRLVFAVELEADGRARARLGEQLARAPRDREVLLQSSSWFQRQGLTRLEEQAREVERQEGPDEQALSSAGRQRADAAVELLRLPELMARRFLKAPLFMVGLIAFWPLVWVVWAGLTRGGLGLRLAGVRLVQGDGRPAARWRCAWRALVVWAPLVLLLLVSLSLDAGRVAGAFGALAWLSWFTWWLAAALVPFYAWVGVRWPNRGPHDALAGTFLVPR